MIHSIVETLVHCSVCAVLGHVGGMVISWARCKCKRSSS